MAIEKGSSHSLQMAGVAKMPLTEKLGIFAVIAKMLGNAFFSILTSFFRSKKRKPSTLWRYISLTNTRTPVRVATLKQLHSILPSTYKSYEIGCKNHGQEVRGEVLPDGTSAFWVGEKNPETLVLHFHGGGYSIPGSPEQFEFLFRAQKQFKSEGHSVSYLALSYDLTPEAQYPRQLEQAATFINYVINDLHYHPNNIILTGDSAGANLILALMSHILHPHPSSTVPRVTLSTPFLGCLLICPWISFSTNYPSFKQNIYKDCIDPTGAQKWIDAFLGKKPKDNYNEPINASKSWWEGFPARNVTTLAGSDEILIDGVKEFNAKFQEALKGKGVNYEFVICPGEYHDQWYLDLQYGYKKDADETMEAKIMKEFVRSKL
ncbi:prolyl oligopeptidase-like protein [Xylogone sp. PMI_703]|nr:prolyl oligopeptidase-like protein [Xylogone sp. PMI_703]